METDPNWLLSTAAQSAAALIAIVAGFIVNKLLALSAERNSMQNRIRDLNIHLSLKINQKDQLQKEKTDLEIFDFLEDMVVLDRIISNKGEISLDDALHVYGGYTQNVEELKPYWEKTIATTKRAFQIFNENLNKIFENDNGLRITLEENGVCLDQHEALIFDRIYDKFQEAIEKSKKPFSLLSTISSNIGLPSFRTKHDTELYDSLEQAIKSSETGISSLKVQISDLKTQLQSFGKPQGITFGLFVLGYFSFVGIVVPLFLLPTTADQFTFTCKWVIFSLFVSGLGLFFYYLIWLVRQLEK